MKLTIDFFEIRFTESTETVAVIRTKNLKQCLNDLNFPAENFKPEVANKALTMFVFETYSDEWDLFLSMLHYLPDARFHNDIPKWFITELYKFKPEHLQSLIQ